MNKIDFAVIIAVQGANPNADPFTNQPRVSLDGYGEMSDVCIKRKIRDTLSDMGENILLQYATEEFPNLKSRILAVKEIKAADKKKDESLVYELACKEWFDVRAFGQLIAYAGTSIGIRGPVSVTSARSLDIVDLEEVAISNVVEAKLYGLPTYRVRKGAYVFYGGIYPQLAKKTGLDEEDVKKIKEALPAMLDGDVSRARPVGSMSVDAVYWWEHNNSSGQYAPITVQRSLKLTPADDYPFYKAEVEPLDGLEPEIINPF